MGSQSSDSVESSQQSSPNPVPRFIPNHLLSGIPMSKRRVPIIVDDSSDSESEDTSGKECISTYYVSPSKPDKRRLLENLIEFLGTNVIGGSLSRANSSSMAVGGPHSQVSSSPNVIGGSLSHSKSTLTARKPLLDFTSMNVVGDSSQRKDGEMFLNSPKSLFGVNLGEYPTFCSSQC